MTASQLLTMRGWEIAERDFVVRYIAIFVSTTYAPLASGTLRYGVGITTGDAYAIPASAYFGTVSAVTHRGARPRNYSVLLKPSHGSTVLEDMCGAGVSRVRALLRDDRGTALSEYAIVLASLSLLMIGVLGLISTGTGNHLNTTQTGMTAWSENQ